MASITGTPVVVAPGGTHTASAGGLEVFLCASERGISNTSPTVLSYGGVDALTGTGGPVTALAQIVASGRAHRWYHIPRANHPGSGARTVACTWAGTDNVAIAVIEVSATGIVSITSNNQNSSGATVAITAGSGDLTLGCGQANSATPAFSPSSGQTEYLESVWYNNTGHVIGAQTGAQTAASWTGAGSLCASAFVIHEEPDGPELSVPLELIQRVLLGEPISSMPLGLSHAQLLGRTISPQPDWLTLRQLLGMTISPQPLELRQRVILGRPDINFPSEGGGSGTSRVVPGLGGVGFKRRM